MFPAGVTDLFSVFILPGGLDGWAVGQADGAANILRWSGAWPTGAWSVFHLARLVERIFAVSF